MTEIYKKMIKFFIMEFLKRFLRYKQRLLSVLQCKITEPHPVSWLESFLRVHLLKDSLDTSEEGPYSPTANMYKYSPSTSSKRSTLIQVAYILEKKEYSELLWAIEYRVWDDRNAKGGKMPTLSPLGCYRMEIMSPIDQIHISISQRVHEVCHLLCVH